jgi:hypothetical protein
MLQYVAISIVYNRMVVLTVHWIANHNVPIHNTVYRTVVSTCSLKNTGIISSVCRCLCRTYILRKLLFQRLILIQILISYKYALNSIKSNAT